MFYSIRDEIPFFFFNSIFDYVTFPKLKTPLLVFTVFVSNSNKYKSVEKMIIKWKVKNIHFQSKRFIDIYISIIIFRHSTKIRFIIPWIHWSYKFSLNESQLIRRNNNNDRTASKTPVFRCRIHGKFVKFRLCLFTTNITNTSNSIGKVHLVTTNSRYNSCVILHWIRFNTRAWLLFSAKVWWKNSFEWRIIYSCFMHFSYTVYRLFR